MINELTPLDRGQSLARDPEKCQKMGTPGPGQRNGLNSDIW